MAIKTHNEERFEKYQETWTKLNPSVKDEVWSPTTNVNFPWSGAKIQFWKTLRAEMQTRFRAVICDECSSEVTTKPIIAFSFVDYSAMVLELLDTYLAGLNDYITIQDDISRVSANMDAYPEDQRPMLEKSMRHSRIKRAQDFLDVLLFLHAVP